MSLKEWLDLGWLLFLLILFGYFWRLRQIFRRAKSWPMTKGRITQLKWVEEDHHLWPKIEYNYRVGGEEFIGEQLFLGAKHNYPNRTARSLAYQAAMAYEKEEEVKVFYNPNNPQESVLNTTIPRKLNFIAVLLGLLISFAILTLAHFL